MQLFEKCNLINFPFSFWVKTTTTKPITLPLPPPPKKKKKKGGGNHNVHKKKIKQQQHIRHFAAVFSKTRVKYDTVSNGIHVYQTQTLGMQSEDGLAMFLYATVVFVP